MSKHTFATVFLILFLAAASAFDSPAQDAEIEKIIKEVSVDNQKGAISNYTYLMKFSFERHKKLAGRKFTRVYEAILPAKIATDKVYPHQILLIKDSEKNLTNEEIMIARQNLAKELERAEKEADSQSAQTNTFEDGGYWTTSFMNDGKKIKVDVMKLLESSKFSNLQRAKIDGKDIVTIDFAPKADAVLEKTLSYLSKIEGQLTIDETDKRIVRIEGYALGEFAAQRQKPEAERLKEIVFLFTQTKVYEGFWFPQTILLNFGKHPEIFEAIEIQYDFSSYKKASVDVKDTIETPKEQTDTTTTEVKQN